MINVNFLGVIDCVNSVENYFKTKYENIWRCYNWSASETYQLAKKFNAWKCAYSSDWYCDKPTKDNFRVFFKTTGGGFERKQDRFNGYLCRKWDSATFISCRKKFLFWWVDPW